MQMKKSFIIPDIAKKGVKEKCPKNGPERAQKLAVNINCRRKKELWKEKSAWDKVFLTFSTEFSTSWISR